MQTYESYAEYYHDLTKYTPEGIASNQHRLDFNKQPTLFKEYPNRKLIDISHLLPLDKNPFSDAGIKNPDSFNSEEKSLSVLSKILYFSNGITAIVPFEDKPFYMRASPSAGGLYPTEIYVYVHDYPGLENGLYNYQALKQSLVQIYKGDLKNKISSAAFNHPAVEKSKIILILTGVFYRSSWRYQDRAYRRICLDTGHVIGNMELVSYSCGLKQVPIGGFNDQLINELLMLDENEEQVLSLISFVDKDSDLNFSVPNALPSKLDNKNIKTSEGNRLLELHQRSRSTNLVNVPNVSIENIEDKFKFSTKVEFEKNARSFGWKDKLLPVILRRRSTRAYTGESITIEELASIFEFTYRPDLMIEKNIDSKPVYFDSSLIQTFIAVNGVDGLEEGCYYFSQNEFHLRQVRFKNFRDEVYYLCLGQELGHKASVVVFHTANLSRAVFKYGERAYRYLHLDAGHLGQRMNLAAINLGLGVSGIGGFFDDQVNEVLGIPENVAVVYITTIGVPAKTS